MQATFDLEALEIERGHAPVCGIDEAGRGPWAGPVVAAAVILDPAHIPAGIADSKALEPEDRERLHARLVEVATFGIGIADVERIDRDNILNATMWAMAEAVRALSVKPKLALVDGNRKPPLNCVTRAIVKGDARCLSIAAASIIAKVTRDHIMTVLADRHPGYGFERHKGYGTPEHQRALRKLGVSAAHRKSFKPVQLALALEAAE
jgi:ribonuclease HII